MRRNNTPVRRVSSVRWTFCAVLICVLPLAVVHAANWSVCAKGCQFATIQAAVNRAAPADVVTIGKGTYFENVVIDKKLTLIGAGEDLTTIDGANRDTVLTVGADTAPSLETVRLIGMTITHGFSTSQAGGIMMHAANLDLQNSIVASNAGGVAGGISQVVGGITVSITKSMITHNRSATDGGGITFISGSLTCASCTIARNTGRDGGGLFVVAGTSVSLTGTTLSDNTATRNGGAIYAESNGPTKLVVTKSVIADNNAAGDGGGIATFADTVVTHSIIARNTAGGRGGGIAAEVFSFSATSGPLEFGDVYVTQNKAGSGTGGVFATFSVLNDFPPITIEDN